MRILDRYILGIFLKNLALAVIGLVGLFIVQALLSDLFDRAYPASQVLYYHFLNLPQILVQMMPPSVLLATVLTLSGLSRNNELIACYAIGIGLRRIVALVLSMVFIICCVILMMEDRVLPPSYKKRTAFYWHEMQKKPDFYLDIRQEKIWYRSKNLIYNLQRFDPDSRTIYGMTVYTFDDNFNLIQTIDAQKAAFTTNGWRLMNGSVTVFTQDSPLNKKFDEKELVINETPKDFQEIEKEVEGLRLKELAKYVSHIKASGADTKSYEVKLYSRISLSFIPIIMSILGVPFSTRTRREGGMAKDVGLCLAITFFYWLFYSIGLSLGSNGALPPLLAAWLPSVIFGAFAVTLIARQRK